jgi:chitinase
MLRFCLRLSLLALLLASCSASTTPTQSIVPDMPALEPSVTPTPTPFRIIAYATEGIVESLIPYDKLTHINYAFLIPNADGTFARINNSWKLKLIVENAHAHNVSVIISVGGWGWDKEFETMAADPARRTAFVQNLKAFVDEYQLDGADIDWEYPDAGQSAQNFLALIQELHAALPDKALTTAVVSHGKNGMGILPETFELFDFVNVMTYDGSDHATLDQFEQGLAFWTARGLPKEKIVMGIPFYSHPEGLPQVTGITYAKLVDANPGAAQTDTFEYNGATQIYNGIPTVQVKTRLAMQKASGIMFWTLDYDAQGELSLVNTIYQTAHP